MKNALNWFLKEDVVDSIPSNNEENKTTTNIKDISSSSFTSEYPKLHSFLEQLDVLNSVPDLTLSAKYNVALATSKSSISEINENINSIINKVQNTINKTKTTFDNEIKEETEKTSVKSKEINNKIVELSNELNLINSELTKLIEDKNKECDLLVKELTKSYDFFTKIKTDISN